MSLINKVAKIIDNEKDVDDVSYIANKVSYDDNISTLDIEFKTIIPPPPKNSSATTSRELDAVIEATTSRTRREIDLVYNVDDSPVNVFLPFLEKRNLNFPMATVNSYYNILEQYMYALKYYFNRARPEQIAPYYNKKINILYTETHHTPSYPSGHTMYAELIAHILSDQYPQYKKDFFELAKYCALARILQGVHYPSDNEASVVATSKLYTKIKEYYEKQAGTKEETLDRQPKT